VKAVVLVGGEGTRLRPLTLTTPKQMLPVGGRPMIERVLEWLASNGIDTAVLSLGYRPDAFMRAYPDGNCCGVALVYAVEDSPLDTAGAIRFAATKAGFDSTFVVVNGDVLTGLDVEELVRFHQTSGALATIALTPVEDPSAFGVVPTEPDGKVIEFIEKPPRDQAPTNLINAGTYVLDPSVLDRIAADRRVSIEREVFPALAAEGAVYALASDADWVDAGTPATYLAANIRYSSEPDGSCDRGSGSEISKSVIGADTAIGEGALVHGSLLMDGTRIGKGAAIRDSILGPGVVVGPGAQVLDHSVIGGGYVVDAGAEVVGARLPAPE
jgi:mannose-1-phosphate guanylyltransferase